MRGENKSLTKINYVMLTRSAIFSIALLAAIPLLSVGSALFFLQESGWGELWQTTLQTYIFNTTFLMLMTGSFAVVLGTGTAWLVATTDFPGRKLFSWLLVLPLAAPPYIIAYLYTDLLEPYGPVQTWLRYVFSLEENQYWLPSIRNILGASVMLGLVLYPYVYLFARASFSQQNIEQWHAARSLGSSPTHAFFKVSLPAARAAIAGGLALVLMETLADFAVAEYFALPTLSTGIFRNWLALGNKIIALKLAAFMLFFVILLIVLESTTRRGRRTKITMTTEQTQLMKLPKLRAIGAMVCCFLPICFGFLVPAFMLLIYAVQNAEMQSRAMLWIYMKNSVYIGLLVAAASTSLAMLLAYAHRYSASTFSRAMIRLSTLGYALPGTLIAVGLFLPLGFVDQSLTQFSRAFLGWNGGLLLSGTLIALTYALTIRFLTISYNGIHGGFEVIPMNIDHAARSLGASSTKRLFKIHIPLLAKSTALSAALVFIDVLRELPITLIMRPFNFETLSTRVYWLASDERLSVASTAALLIILVGIIPAVILNHIAKPHR